MKAKHLFAVAGALGTIGGAAAYLHRKKNKENEQVVRNKIILSKNLWRNQDTKQTKINNNFLLIGDGETASEHFIIPNILEQTSSYIVIDPEGKIYRQVKDRLIVHEEKCLNLSSHTMDGCISYNPFAYAKEEWDMLQISDCLVMQNRPGEKLWNNLQKILLVGCMFHLLETGEKLSFKTLYNLLCHFSDDLFASDSEDGLAAKYLKAFTESAAGPTKDAIVKACINCLEPFRFFGEEDGCDLKALSDKKIALFLITDTEPNTISKVLIPLLFTQLYGIQRRKVEKIVINHESESIPYSSVTCFLQGKEYLRVFDQDFDHSENISSLNSLIFCTLGVDLVFVSKKVLDRKEDSATGVTRTTAAHCDSVIYYSSPDFTTLQYVSERIGNKKTFSHNKNSTRQILTTSELLQLPKNKCVVVQRNQKTAIDDVY